MYNLRTLYNHVQPMYNHGATSSCTIEMCPDLYGPTWYDLRQITITKPHHLLPRQNGKAMFVVKSQAAVCRQDLGAQRHDF